MPDLTPELKKKYDSIVTNNLNRPLKGRDLVYFCVSVFVGIAEKYLYFDGFRMF